MRGRDRIVVNSGELVVGDGIVVVDLADLGHPQLYASSAMSYVGGTITGLGA